jgi:hypothetical protein
MTRAIRAFFIIGGLLFFVLTAGFFFQHPLVLRLWPWEDSRLSYIFLASICAAIGAPLVWIGLSGEFAAAAPGALNLGLMAAGMAVFLFGLYQKDRQLVLLYWALAQAAFVLLNALIFLWSLGWPPRDRRATPRPLRLAFLLFCALLGAVGSALILQQPEIFPWPLKPESSVMFGLVFLGAAVYFVYALLQPRWALARGQLLGFLAYDLVLIVPFLAHFAAVRPGHRLSLIVYTGVLLISALLAVYYLFLNRGTREW